MTETIRAARTSDLSDIAVLLDTASHGLLKGLWRQLAAPGQSAYAVGRERIRTRTDLPSFLGNWHVIVRNGEVCGGHAGYVVPSPFDPGDVSDLPDYYEPLLKLEAQATGTWHMIALAVFPAFRGRGIGTTLLQNAERCALLSRCTTMSIIAKRSNQVARSLYEGHGYSRVAEHRARPLPGERQTDRWFLYQRHLSNS